MNKRSLSKAFIACSRASKKERSCFKVFLSKYPEGVIKFFESVEDFSTHGIKALGFLLVAIIFILLLIFLPILFPITRFVFSPLWLYFSNSTDWDKVEKYCNKES